MLGIMRMLERFHVKRERKCTYVFTYFLCRKSGIALTLQMSAPSAPRTCGILFKGKRRRGEGIKKWTREGERQGAGLEMGKG